MSTDRYVPSAVGADGKRYNLPPADGAQLQTMMVTFEKTSDDDDGSIIRVARGFQKQQIKSIRIENETLSGATDIDVGIYKGEGGAVVDATAFADGLNIASGNAIMSGVIAMSNVALSDRNKSVQELAGVDKNFTMPVGGFDICLTGNTFGTAEDTINVIIDFVG